MMDAELNSHAAGFTVLNVSGRGKGVSQQILTEFACLCVSERMPRQVRIEYPRAWWCATERGFFAFGCADSVAGRREMIKRLEQRAIAEANQLLLRHGMLTRPNRDTLPNQKCAAASARTFFVLQKTDWKIKGVEGAAELLGVKPNTLFARIEKMGLKRPA